MRLTAAASSGHTLERHALTDHQLLKIYSIAGNTRCCDCGRSDPKPSWASVSHGVVLCIECSGVHRSLGVVTSFVKSLTMDSWTNAQLDNMMYGGNKKIKDFFQARGVAPGACRLGAPAGTPARSRSQRQRAKGALVPLSITDKYSSHNAEIYREELLAARTNNCASSLESRVANSTTQSQRLPSTQQVQTAWEKSPMSPDGKFAPPVTTNSVPHVETQATGTRNRLSQRDSASSSESMGASTGSRRRSKLPTHDKRPSQKIGLHGAKKWPRQRLARDDGATLTSTFVKMGTVVATA
eukprot:INCI15459.2.p1 GENE.INCI15459.2~~INCI15459.2.p1  ORF type:complete len:297 (-),score=34.58 INCI15459.2:538-1428(-)